ncbi:MAG: transposase [Acidimicrobiales bacterium]
MLRHARVYLVCDNGSSHRGRASIERTAKKWPNVLLVHLPVHASWLNQIEIVFSILQRKVLSPNDLTNLLEMADRIVTFERHFNAAPRPFDWRFTRADLEVFLKRLAAHEDLPSAVA